jgi:hypothetical protein
MNQDDIIILGEENNLIGIYSYHPGFKCDTTVIMLNAGIIHRVGPNQLYTKLSKQLSSLKISTFRFDFPGIGDSSLGESDRTYEGNYYKSALTVIDYLHSNKGISKFILVGICSGADISLQTALHSDKVCGICFINGEYFNIEELPELLYPMVNQYIAIRFNIKNILNFKRWIKLATNKTSFSYEKTTYIFRFVINSFKDKFKLQNAGVNEIDSNAIIKKLSDSIILLWRSLVDKKVNIYQIYSEGSIGLDLYKMLLNKHIQGIKDNRLKVEIVKNVDHTFTTIWSQSLLADLICHWVEALSVDTL